MIMLHKKLKVVGVTATNGKTSTTTIIDSILRYSQYTTALLGTVVNKIGNYEEKAILTTPESKDLQKLFYKMIEEDIDVCVMEVSSNALELKRVHDVDFDIVAMNNISREHLDQHGSFENYFFYKQKLITEAKKEAIAIINLDDEYASTLLTKTKAQVITFSLKNEIADIYCSDIDINKIQPTFTLHVKQPIHLRNGKTIEQGSHEFTLSIGGYHSVMNATSAICCALCIGVKMNDIINGLKQFGGVERRFQLIYQDEFKVFDDHFANEGNVNATLQSVNMMQYENFNLVYAIRGDRGVQVNLDVIETLIKWKNRLKIKNLIVTAYEDFKIPNNIVTEEEKEIVLKTLDQHEIPYTYYPHLYDAIQHTINKSKQGDIVLLAGCQGMDNGAKTLLNVLKNNSNANCDALEKLVEKRVAGE